MNRAEVVADQPALPVHAVLPDLLMALRNNSNAVLVAPPGAGKTTAVPPALLDEPWCTGRVLLLSPRRLAARAAAERMASLAGEAVGATVGYRTRLDSRISAVTRIEVITEGIFTARIQSDPELAGISAVLFDEIHERSLEGDLGLALALDAQGGLRPDLRLLAMSATLDGARVSALMAGPVIESAGRSYPIELRHLGRDASRRIEDGMAAAIHCALAEETGSVLAFLPGVAEIERTAERLTLPPDCDLHRLHGTLDPAAQRAAIAPAPPGRRKVLLATAIAETSITIDGVRVVIDSGLARRPRYDRAAGLTRLMTERVSRAAADQRAGRAGRTAPGIAIRLWEEAATAALPAFDPPEILEADLSGLVLDLALWGVIEPASLAWLDPPPAPAVAEARTRLQRLAAFDADNHPTAHGKAMAALPLPPRLAHMLLAAGDHDLARTAARVAVLLGERGLGGPGADLDTRLRRWLGARERRAEAARGLADRWARLVNAGADAARADAIGLCIALAYPDRVARRRSNDGDDWLTAGGRGLKLDSADPLARGEWLAVAEAQGSAAAARIMAAAPIEAETVELLFGAQIISERSVRFDPATGGVVTERARRLGAIILSRGPDSGADKAAVTAALLVGVRDHGLAMLAWPEAAAALRARVAFARSRGADLASLDDEALLTRFDDWLSPLLEGVRRLDAIPADRLTDAMRGLIGWENGRALDKAAPARLETPAGTSHAIDYSAEGGPTVHLRVQELFGLKTHPMAGDTPLVLALTSPAGRPIQTTRDLPGFWAGSWAAVRAEMRGRYPRHPWPENPADALATTRTKRADARK